MTQICNLWSKRVKIIVPADNRNSCPPHYLLPKKKLRVLKHTPQRPVISDGNTLPLEFGTPTAGNLAIPFSFSPNRKGSAMPSPDFYHQICTDIFSQFSTDNLTQIIDNIVGTKTPSKIRK